MKKKVISIILVILIIISLFGLIFWISDYIYCFTTEPKPDRFYANHKVFIGLIIFHTILLISLITMFLEFKKKNNVYIGLCIMSIPFLLFSIYRIIFWITNISSIVYKYKVDFVVETIIIYACLIIMFSFCLLLSIKHCFSKKKY